MSTAEVIQAKEQIPKTRPPRRLQRLACLLRWASGAFLMAVCLCFWKRWDAVAVITLPPFWAWGTIGLLLSAVAWRLHANWKSKFLMAAWLLASLVLSEDLFCLVKTPFRSIGWGSRRPNAPVVRIVSLNCAGQVAAVRETWAFKPDIVLLQESPSRDDVAGLCREWFGNEGNYLFGLDCSILARGTVEVLAQPKSLRFVLARVQLAGHPTMQVASVRLHPPDVRLDLWSPRCWKEHRGGRLIRRAQLQELGDHLQPTSNRSATIVGGDFNAPGGDAIFRLLDGSLKDAFTESGRGWGNTAINSFPIARPDQIWISRSATATSLRAKKTENSDHRMIICDIAL